MILNANGASASKTVTVAEGTRVDTVAIGTPVGTIAGNATLKIPVEVTNNKGEAITKLADLNGLTPEVTGGTGSFVEEDGKLYIQTTTNSVSKGSIGNLIVTVTTPTNKIANKVFQVQPNAKATALVGLDSKVSTSILQGGSVEINEKDFIVEDQYGNRMTNTANYGIIADSKDQFTVESSDDIVTVTAGATADTTTLTFTLTDGSGNEVSPVSTIDVKFAAVKSSDFKSYKADNIGTVFATNDTAYFKDLKVYGVTAAGKEVLLPAGGDYYNVVDEKGVNYNNSTGQVSVENNYVDTDATTTTIPETKDVSLTVVINATGQEINVTGSATAVEPKATKVEVRAGGVKTGELQTTVNDVDGTVNASDFTSLLYVEDQYGVELTDDSNVKLTFTNLVNGSGGDAPTITGNGTTSAHINGFATGDTLTVKITDGSVSTTVNVRR